MAADTTRVLRGERVVHVDEGNDAAALLGRRQRLKQERTHADTLGADDLADDAPVSGTPGWLWHACWYGARIGDLGEWWRDSYLDIDKLTNFPSACKDKRGRLRVGAAVGVNDYERAEALIKAGADVIVVDSAHGHSNNIVETVRQIKKRWTIEFCQRLIILSQTCIDNGLLKRRNILVLF